MTAFVQYIPAAVLGYCLGCVNLAWLLARLRGFDIRSYGSHNAGASNATVTMGWKAGVATGVCDIAKSCAAALLSALLFSPLPCAGVVAGVSAVLGHIFPFYLRFRGGKGFASFMGLILALDWRFFLALVLVVLLVTVLTDYIVVGTLTAIVSFPAYLATFSQASITAILVVSAASLAILMKHFINIRRLMVGEEIGLRRTMSKKDRVS